MNQAPTTGWSREGAVELMKAKYLEGWSASQISAHLKAKLGVIVSRNAVIGKAHRLGLTGTAPKHAKPSAPRMPKEPRQPAARRTYAKPVPVFAAPAVADAPVVPVKIGHLWPVPATAAPMLELAANGCRFPVGPTTGAELLCCGAERAPNDKAYCAGHRAVTGGAVTPLDQVPMIKTLPRFARW